MNIESNLSGHWTDEQLIEHLYGIGPEGNHIGKCDLCRERLSRIIGARRAVESVSSALDQVPFELLAAQRRSIYSRIGSCVPRWSVETVVRRWAGAGAMIALLGGGAFFYEQNQQRQAMQNKVTDAQLAQEVGRIASDSEPSPTAPLQALFDE